MYMETLPQLKGMLNQESAKKRFTEILGKKAPGFISSVINVVNGSTYLSKCDPKTILGASVVAASLDLPVDPNLGFSAIVPYGNKAQFQIMYKGLIQLAMRSGQYKTIGATPIYKGQLIKYNPLTSEHEFNFDIPASGKPIGYAAYFKLVNGFEKLVYWDVEKIRNHGKRFSQVFKKGGGLWIDDFDSMAMKTVIKNLLSKWGVLSIEMQNAVKFDQGFIDPDTDEVEYDDNPNDGEIIDTVGVEENEPQTAKRGRPSKEEEDKDGLDQSALEFERDEMERQAKEGK